jgi:16S rRNA (cytosine967-C5)-methyltransferase
MCAAPGGKTVALAWSGFDVTASDQGAERLKLLESTLQRVRLENVRVGEPGTGLFDLVWVDAPCSSSGILRKHPEIRWVKAEKDIDALSETQKKLIVKGWAAVKPGGYLAYSVCSVFRAESDDVIKSANLSGAEKVYERFLSPQDPPHGDGLWAVVFQKPPIYK